MGFQPLGEQARWKTVYEILQATPTDVVITYEELGDALTLDAEADRHAIQMAMRRAAAELESEDKRAVDPVLAKRVKGKTNVQQQTGNQQKQQSFAQTATNGNFRRIAKSPSQLGLAVDWSRTDNEMYAKETAYIKGEKQAVKWGKA